MDVLHSRCCGLDVHKSSISACILLREAGRVQKHQRRFGAMTQELQELAEWLRQFGVSQVAMESSGVYWKPVWNILEGQFTLLLVNAQHIKNVPGRKTDVQECQWLMKLHTYGLVRDSFRLPADIEPVRTIWRLRDRHVKEAGESVQHMQKALAKMNIQLANVISDISGTTGLAILCDIVGGSGIHISWRRASTAEFAPAVMRLLAAWKERGGRSCYLF